MSNLEVIENKISAIKKYLKILENYKKYSLESIKKDINIRGSLERYLYLVSQATIDLAEAVIAYKELRKPTTMAESFYILEENNIINQKMLDKLVKMTGFRNVMVHDYEDIDYDIVYDVLQNKLIDIEKFIKKIK